MKTTKLIFLRHADTKKDPSMSATQWELSEKGKDQAVAVALLPLMAEVDSIYVSEEKKTTLTIEPLIKKTGKEVRKLGFFNEVRRGDTFLTKEEFGAEKIKQLTDLDYRAFGGESGKEALSRFKKGVDYIVEQDAGKTILIVTHGTILNIYFANILDVYKDLLERWDKTSFCAYGVMENGKVIKDIV